MQCYEFNSGLRIALYQNDLLLLLFVVIALMPQLTFRAANLLLVFQLQKKKKRNVN